MSNYKTVKMYGVEVDLTKEGHTTCPKCRKERGGDRSGNNMMVYGEDADGMHRGSFCFACQFSIPDEKYMIENGQQQEQEWELVGSEFNEEVHKKIKENSGVASKGYRGIREDISKPFGVRYEYDGQGEVAKVYYPTTINYGISGYKVRNHPKTFSAVGEVGKNCEMFGQFRFKTMTNTLLIVGGEHDTLAAFQMLSDAQKNKAFDPVAVVSSTVGEATTAKQAQLQYDFINQFKKIVIALDADEAGDEATSKLVESLPKGKVFVMKMRLKDPNSYIWNKETGKLVNREQEFISDFWAAKPYTPSGIVGSSGLLDKIREAEQVEKVPLPPFMKSVQNLMCGGIPLKRIVTFVAASGAGKSTITDECVYYWIFNSPHRVGVLSLESDSAEYGKKLLSRHISQKIDLIETVEEKLELLDSPNVKDKSTELFSLENGSDRFDVVDDRDGSLEEIKELILKLILNRGCKLIVLDPLSDAMDGLDANQQRVMMKWLKGITKAYDVSFVLVAHVRKNGSGAKANSTGADLHEEDISGSGSIFQSSSAVVIFSRDKEAEDEITRNTTTMKVTKLRWTGQTSPTAGKFYYDNKTHTVHDFDTYFSNKVG